MIDEAPPTPEPLLCIYCGVSVVAASGNFIYMRQVLADPDRDGWFKPGVVRACHRVCGLPSNTHVLAVIADDGPAAPSDDPDDEFLDALLSEERAP